MQDEISRLATEIESEEKEKKLAQLEKRKRNLFLKFGRTGEVYVMINVRTDGKNIIIAQKLEQKADRGLWDIHCFQPIEHEDGTSILIYVDNMEKHV
jgi:hypothetical protein